MEVGPGDLPGLLRRIVSSTTPTPSATPAPSGSAAREEKEEDVVTEGEAATLFTPIKEELERMGKKEEGGWHRLVRDPVPVSKPDGSVLFGCGNCAAPPMKTKRGMDAHIRSVHTKEAFVCHYCDFTTYNLDSFQSHEKKGCGRSSTH